MNTQRINRINSSHFDSMEGGRDNWRVQHILGGAPLGADALLALAKVGSEARTGALAMIEGGQVMDLKGVDSPIPLTVSADGTVWCGPIWDVQGMKLEGMKLEGGRFVKVGERTWSTEEMDAMSVDPNGRRDLKHFDPDFKGEDARGLAVVKDQYGRSLLSDQAASGGLVLAKDVQLVQVTPWGTYVFGKQPRDTGETGATGHPTFDYDLASLRLQANAAPQGRTIGKPGMGRSGFAAGVLGENHVLLVDAPQKNPVPSDSSGDRRIWVHDSRSDASTNSAQGHPEVRVPYHAIAPEGAELAVQRNGKGEVVFSTLERYEDCSQRRFVRIETTSGQTGTPTVSSARHCRLSCGHDIIRDFVLLPDGTVVVAEPWNGIHCNSIAKEAFGR